MTDPLQTLEADLTILASSTGQPTAALKGAQDVLALLADNVARRNDDRRGCPERLQGGRLGD